MGRRTWASGTTITSKSGCASASATRRDRDRSGHRPLAAALNTGDRRHAECASLLLSLTGRRLLPSPVMTEVCWLLERWPKVEAAFLAQVARGTFELVHLTPADVTRMGELVLQYADFPLGGVDASVIAVAERFGVDRVATLDRRHFSVVKPAHVPTLTLLP